MPLNKGCSKQAAQENFRMLYKEGKRNPQLSAIVLNVLRKACGVPKDAPQMSQKEILGSKTEGKWIGLDGMFESLPSSPVVRGLSFVLPGGMRGVGTSPSASPPDSSRGLLGGLTPPIPLVKCSKCGKVFNGQAGRCPSCAKTEAVGIDGGMRMSPLIGASASVECEGCGGPVRLGKKCPKCGKGAWAIL